MQSVHAADLVEHPLEQSSLCTENIFSTLNTVAFSVQFPASLLPSWQSSQEWISLVSPASHLHGSHLLMTSVTS